jgi:hypothetical protein
LAAQNAKKSRRMRVTVNKRIRKKNYSKNGNEGRQQEEEKSIAKARWGG